MILLIQLCSTCKAHLAWKGTSHLLPLFTAHLLQLYPNNSDLVPRMKFHQGSRPNLFSDPHSGGWHQWQALWKHQFIFFCSNQFAELQTQTCNRLWPHLVPWTSSMLSKPPLAVSGRGSFPFHLLSLLVLSPQSQHEFLWKFAPNTLFCPPN